MSRKIKDENSIETNDIGSKAIEDQVEIKKTKKKLRNNNLFRLFCALLLMCACAALGGGIAVYEEQSNPTSYVAEYFGKFLMGRFDEMYEYVYTDNKFISKNSYVSLMNSIYENTHIGEYEFEEIEEMKDGRYRMRVTYKDTHADVDKWMDIYLVKRRESAAQIIGEWKVSVDEYLLNDFEVEVPAGMRLIIDGEVVEKNSPYLVREGEDVLSIGENETVIVSPPITEEDDSQSSVYKFRQILKGPHVISIETDYTVNTMNVEVVVNNQKMMFDVDKNQIKSQYLEYIKQNSAEMVQKYYEDVRKKKKDSKELKAYFVENDEVQKKLKKYLKKDIETIYWPEKENIDEFKLTQCIFSEMEPAIEYLGDGKFQVAYKYNYEYLLSTDTELYSSYVETISGVCDTTLNLVYVAEKDDLKIEDIEIKNKNQKEQEEEE